MKRPTWKRIVLWLAYGILGICAIPVIAYFLPFPIEGNWLNPWLLSCMCKRERGCHLFYRFENGKILWMSNTHFPPVWEGTYRKKGWGKYEIEIFGWGYAPFVAYSSPLRIATSGEWCVRTFRDPSSACQVAVNHPSNEWMCVSGGKGFRVAGTPEERVFLNREQQTKGELEAKLNYMFKQPLQIYTASDEVSSAVVEALVTNGIDYVIRANQEWIVSDTLRTNPVWSAATYQTEFCLIVTPPPEPPERKYGMTENSIYLMRERSFDFGGFVGKIESHRRHRDYWKKDTHLYVADGIVPEDVKQLFAQFDIEYAVSDEKVLYRGKGKGK